MIWLILARVTRPTSAVAAASASLLPAVLRNRRGPRHPCTPLFVALHGLEKYIVLISDVQSGANKFLSTIKAEVENNAELRRAYPEICRPGPVWREEAVELPNGVRIEALGKG